MSHHGNENSDMSTAERIPIFPLRPFFDKGHILYMENYCASP